MMSYIEQDSFTVASTTPMETTMIYCQERQLKPFSTTPTSSIIYQESETESETDSRSRYSETEDETIVKQLDYSVVPSYMIVFNQLHDVIHTQRKALANYEKQNNDLCAKEVKFNRTVSSQAERIHELQTSIVHQHVPKSAYKSLLVSLQATQYGSEQKISSMLEEQAQDKEAVECRQEQLKILMTDFKNVQLEHGKLKENIIDKSLKICQQQEIITRQHQEILGLKKQVESLQSQLKQQQEKMNQSEIESEIARKQGAYLAQMVNSDNKKE